MEEQWWSNWKRLQDAKQKFFEIAPKTDPKFHEYEANVRERGEGDSHDYHRFALDNAEKHVWDIETRKMGYPHKFPWERAGSLSETEELALALSELEKEIRGKKWYKFEFDPVEFEKSIPKVEEMLAKVEKMLGIMTKVKKVPAFEEKPQDLSKQEIKPEAKEEIKGTVEPHSPEETLERFEREKAKWGDAWHKVRAELEEQVQQSVIKGLPRGMRGDKEIVAKRSSKAMSEITEELKRAEQENRAPKFSGLDKRMTQVLQGLFDEKRELFKERDEALQALARGERPSAEKQEDKPLGLGFDPELSVPETESVVKSGENAEIQKGHGPEKPAEEEKTLHEQKEEIFERSKRQMEDWDNSFNEAFHRSEEIIAEEIMAKNPHPRRERYPGDIDIEWMEWKNRAWERAAKIVSDEVEEALVQNRPVKNLPGFSEELAKELFEKWHRISEEEGEAFLKLGVEALETKQEVQYRYDLRKRKLDKVREEAYRKIIDEIGYGDFDIMLHDLMFDLKKAKKENRKEPEYKGKHGKIIQALFNKQEELKEERDGALGAVALGELYGERERDEALRALAKGERPSAKSK